MKAIELQKKFGLENLRVSERPTPKPGPGEVLLRMSAASLNYRDLLMVKGQYNPRQALPIVPCSDGVGQIVDVGQGVDKGCIGQRCIPLFAQQWHSGPPMDDHKKTTLGGPIDGCLCEFLVVPQSSLVLAPEHLTDVQAASLPCAGLTAWNVLITYGNLRPGQTILIQGSGGVAIFALQIAKMVQARTIVTTGSDEKVDILKSMGADEVINYRRELNWGKRVKEISHGLGADIVLEVGGAGTLQQSLVAVKTGGFIGLVGVLSGNAGSLDIVPLLMRQIRIQGVFVGNRQNFQEFLQAVDKSQVQPKVWKTFPMLEVRTALLQLECGQHIGKICLTWDQI